MGIRMTQMQGLPKVAQEFLDVHAERVDVCPHCNRDSGPLREEIGRTGMFNEYELYRYKLKPSAEQGSVVTRTADEVVQYEYWSSGPMIWLKLVVSDGTVFEWAKDVIEDDCV